MMRLKGLTIPKTFKIDETGNISQEDYNHNYEYFPKLKGDIDKLNKPEELTLLLNEGWKIVNTQCSMEISGNIGCSIVIYVLYKK